MAIQGSDINYKSKQLSISKSVYWKSSKPYIKEPKTRSGVRSVPIPEILIGKMPQLTNEEYLFGGEKLMTQTQYRHSIDKFRKTSGIDITAHQLRHGYATLFYQAGVDVKSAQNFLGHANIAMTMDVYTHISEEQKNKSAKTFNKFISKKFTV